MSSPGSPRPALHPGIRAVLDRTKGQPPLQAVPLDVLRSTATARFAGRAKPVPVERIEALRVPAAGHDIPVRLYRPVGPGPLPVIVFLHGGGYVMCDLDTYDPFCRRLCVASGCAVASIDYRLAPEHPCPAALDDALRATLCLAEWGPKLGLDPQRLALCGDSAGGGLAAATAIALRDRAGAMPRAQALLYPMLDAPDRTRASYVENGAGYGLDTEAVERFWSLYGAPEPDSNRDLRPGDNTRATPLRTASLARLPPTLVVTAGYDVLRDEGHAYATRLAAAGVAVTQRCYDDMAHGFLFGAGAFDPATEALERIGDWLATALR